MLTNYLKVFFNNLFRQKVITFINIIGLSVGMAVFILISLYVKEEYSHEQRWDNANRIVRVVSTIKLGASAIIEDPSSSQLALAKLKEFFPDLIEFGARVHTTGQTIMVDEAEFQASVNYVDAGFLNVFNLEELSGSLAATLSTPGQIALEEEFAKTYFPSEAVGNSLILKLGDGSERHFEVAAVYRLPEGNGELSFPNFTLLTESLLPEFSSTDNDWFNGVDVRVYLLLNEADSDERINARTDELVDQNIKVPWLQPADAPASNGYSLRVQPIRDSWFNPVWQEIGGSSLAANSFALVAALVLLIAVINFVILSVARSAERVREVGVRKANGAVSRQLQTQFLVESFLQVALAFCVALAFYEVLKPLFEKLMGTELLTQIFSLQYFIWGFVLVAVITLLGGMYPAFVLAAVKPEHALKTGGSRSTGNTALRKVLVSFQFTIAVGLIIVTLAIYQQLFFVKHRNAGLDVDRVVSVVLLNDNANEYGQAMLNEVARIEGVSLVTWASRVAIDKFGFIQSVNYSKEDGADGPAPQVYAYSVGYNFFPLYSMDIVAGRNFSREQDQLPEPDQSVGDRSYVTKVVLNESAVKDYGFSSPTEAVGTRLYTMGYAENGDEIGRQYFEIIGVVADSQFDSLRTEPTSDLYRLTDSSAVLSFRVSEAAINSVRSDLESVWRDVVGIGRPAILFARDAMAQEFAKEENEGRLLSGFAFLAIVVSCMGLYGLVAFDTARRTKEIGVRKVLGGQLRNIQSMFLQQYFWSMLVANFIAWPVAVWAMQQWLERFPYQIQLWVFIPICFIAGVVVLVIAGSTLWLTVLMAFRAKPAQALRYE